MAGERVLQHTSTNWIAKNITELKRISDVACTNILLLVERLADEFHEKTKNAIPKHTLNNRTK